MSGYTDEWKRLFGMCESPIELHLADAFEMHWPKTEPAFGFCTPELVWDAETRGVRLVFAQYRIGRFFADFLVVDPGRTPLVIECDGWAYHQGDSLTHEKDFERDQAIRRQGFETVHFGGSRIKSDTMDVLRIIENALAGKFREGKAA